jgi:hypothetical protein
MGDDSVDKQTVKSGQASGPRRRTVQLGKLDLMQRKDEVSYARERWGWTSPRPWNDRGR